MMTEYARGFEMGMTVGFIQGMLVGFGIICVAAAIGWIRL